MAYVVFLLLALAAVKGGAEMLCEPDAYGEPPAASTARPRLRRDLLCQYDRQSAPRKFVNITTEVFVRRARVVHRTLEAEVLASLRWTDQFLTWDPAQYDGVQEVQISSNDIWIPPIVTYNTLPWFRDDDRPQADFWPVLCSVSSNGNVRCTSGTEMGGSCEVSSFYWPHVQADCSSFIGPDFRLHKDISVMSVNESGQTEMSYYIPGNDWIVTTLEKRNFAFGPDPFMATALIYRIKLHSRGVNISAALIGPAVVLSLMLLGSFILPIKSFTRLGLCCCSTFGTVLASSLLFEYLEPYEDPSPLVVTFYTGLLILSAIATFMVLLVNIVVPKSTKPPEAPRWLYSFQTWLFHAEVGKLCLKALALSAPEQRGELPGVDNGRSEDNEDPNSEEAASPVQMSAQRSPGPDRIWDFTASFLNRCVCIIFLLAFSVLGLYLAHAVTIYEDPEVIE
ncbi:acetylcholine receptor subunit alpha-L1-like isoform X2 [Thrips palmi]|uniref:Acetylcholine receptor subunit alpha-L1-like isoform X2 n=1 Tax=Thrips palmi TaxID=161013 RepID=A0A6P9A0M2_THRPL|nr:acetylcholine receptor subunit alpha-L1-like isoform X2 [Thrips palmi]